MEKAEGLWLSPQTSKMESFATIAAKLSILHVSCSLLYSSQKNKDIYQRNLFNANQGLRFFWKNVSHETVSYGKVIVVCN